MVIPARGSKKNDVWPARIIALGKLVAACSIGLVSVLAVWPTC